jgi:hypothetical protein
MKKNSVPVMLAVLLWAGCTSPPEWFGNPPQDENLVYGTGMDRGDSEAQGWALAETGARADLAGRIGGAMGPIQVPGSEEAGPLTVPIPEPDLSGAVVEKREAIGRRYYVMLSYPKESIRRQAIDSALGQLQEEMNAVDAELAGLAGISPLDDLPPADGPPQNGVPFWIGSPPQGKRFIFGVGSYRGANPNMAMTMAQTRANADIAKQINTVVERMTVRGPKGTETITLSTSKVTLEGVKTVEGEFIDGTFYVLVAYPKSMIWKQALGNTIRQLQAALNGTD